MGKGEFNAIDKYAVTAPATVSDNTGALAKYLKKGAKNETEQARAIFAWVASSLNYDYVEYSAHKQPNRSSAWILKNRVAVCAGFASLYKEIADSMGLEAVIIDGYGKNNTFARGSHFEKTNHVWNAVKADGHWLLLDATWARNEGENAEANPITHTTFDDYWFATPPVEFAFLHYALKQQWMLMADTFSLSQFEQLPYAGAAFFKLGFNAQNLLQQCLSTPNLTIPITYKSHHDIKLVDFSTNPTLPADTAHTFTIESPEDVSIALINNNKWLYFTRNGNRYTITAPITTGKLSFDVKGKRPEDRFWTVVVYQVL